MFIVMIKNYIKVLNGRNEGGLNKLREGCRGWIPKTLIHSHSPFPHCAIATGFTEPTYTFFCTAAFWHVVITCTQTHTRMWVEQQMRTAPTSTLEPRETCANKDTKSLCNTCQLLKIVSYNISCIYSISTGSKIRSICVEKHGRHTARETDVTDWQTENGLQEFSQPKGWW